MKTVLYVGARRAGGDSLGLAERSEARLDSKGALFLDVGVPIELHEVAEPRSALAFLRRRAVDLLLIDDRDRPFSSAGENPSQPLPFAAGRAGALIEALYPEDQVQVLVPRDRIVGIVGEGREGVESARRMGEHRIGTVLASPDAETLIAKMRSLLAGERRGKVAICLAGGGIEGLFYELGVLRALDAFLVDRSLVDLDFFCGISAGAVLGSLLANGIGPDEIARGLVGSSHRVDPIKRSDLFDPNVGELRERGLSFARNLLRGGAGPRSILSSLTRAIPSGLFAGARLRQWLERQLTRPGMSDRFGDLRRPLFIGATDQDTSEPVVFGEPGHDHVPVHRAVRASAALVPFYAPETIEGRHYVDGAFTRTTNMRVAVRQGATMVILIDPLVPVYSEQAGYVKERGGVFVAMQGLKALINGRFDKAVTAIQETAPDVSFYLFRPHGDEMRILSGSPMKYFYRREVEDIAFQTTAAKIRACLPEMQRDFARHGIRFADPEEPEAGPLHAGRGS